MDYDEILKNLFYIHFVNENDAYLAIDGNNYFTIVQFKYYPSSQKPLFISKIRFDKHECDRVQVEKVIAAYVTDKNSLKNIIHNNKQIFRTENS